MINTNTIIYIHDYLTNYFKDLEDPIQPPGIKIGEALNQQQVALT